MLVKGCGTDNIDQELKTLFFLSHFINLKSVFMFRHQKNLRRRVTVRSLPKTKAKIRRKQNETKIQGQPEPKPNEKMKAKQISLNET